MISKAIKVRRGRRLRFITIYEIKSIRSGRVYIGSSKDTFMRWNQHLYGIIMNTHSNKELIEEYKLYGISNFTFRILRLLPVGEDIRKIEQSFLNKFISKELFNKRKSYKG